MEVTSGAEEGFIREWTPCTHILNLIPPRIQNGLFSHELCLTCVDAVSEYIALGTNVGLVYWYDRKRGNIQRLRCEASNSPITYVKIVSTVDYMVGAGNAAGQVTVFQIPKEHPESVPDNFKPKTEPVERYTIGDLHKSKITAIEWSKNGMRLFSGDKNGVIIMTEIDFYMHLCKSMEIVNEEHEIVQMSYCQNALLVSSVYRTIVCERRDARWHVNQLGKKERKSLCALGAVFQYSYARGAGGAGAAGGAAAYCARPGLRLWRADVHGTVHQTLLFKEAISNPLTVAELLNPASLGSREAACERSFGPLHVFREHFLVAHDARALYVLDPRSLTAVAVVDDLRRILSVSVHREEIFVLEGPRSLVRLAHAPDAAPAAADDAMNLMTRSLTTSIQQAVNTVRDFTHIDQTVPYISSVLEQPISMFTRAEAAGAGAGAGAGAVARGEECFELPPVHTLPADIPGDVLESIGNEFRDVSSDAEELRRAKSLELQRKLKLYNSIMDVQRRAGEQLVHRSRRAHASPARASPAHAHATPAHASPARASPARATPVHSRAQLAVTSPCLMNISVHGDAIQNDDLLDKEIEEKEKILAKMLNLESLSIAAPNAEEKTEKTENTHSTPTYKRIHVTPLIEPDPEPVTPKVTPAKAIPDPNPIDLVPKIVQLPNNWNLGNIELKLDRTNGFKEKSVVSPDEHLDSDWEII